MGFEGSRVETRVKVNGAGLALAILAFAGCGGDKSVAPGPPTATDTVHVSPDTLALDLGSADSLTASLVDDQGDLFDGTVEWTVRDTTKIRRIVTMALTAPILPVAAGVTYVVASVPDGVSDSAKVVVTAVAPPPPPPPPTVTQTLYVAPAGSGSACTLAEPCALAAAFARSADTILVRAGAYPATTISRSGTATRPLVVRAFPDERATFPSLMITGANVWLWGLEVANGPNGVMGVNVRAPGVHVINLVVHDTGISGVGHWMEAPDGEVYGSLIYHAGRTLNLDHGIYAQNSSGSKLIEDNLLWENAAYGVHIYTSAGQFARNITLRGNIGWNNGSLEARPEFLVGGNTVVTGIRVDSNATYRTDRGETADLGWRNGVARHGDLIFRDNYFVGSIYLTTAKWTSIDQADNIVTTSDRDTVIVRPNRYEPGRANIGVWNPSGAASVSVTVPGIGGWRLQRAEDFYGPPVATGSGPSVTVPMAGAEFDAFVLLPDE